MPTLLTEAERLQRAKGIRMYAVKLLAYYIATLVVTVPLSFFWWLGNKCEDIAEWIDRPAYRWRSAQEELDRELIRDNRRKAEAAAANPTETP